MLLVSSRVIWTLSLLLGLSSCTKPPALTESATTPNPALKVSGPIRGAQYTGGFFENYETELLSPAEKRGRLIWYQATGGNAEFHSYVIPQRFGVYIDWNLVLNSKDRGTRFKRWGLINDPGCRPGNKNSFGFDICEGDDELLQFVGKEGYVDPACDIERKIPGMLETYSRGDSCSLAFGTSAGAVGIRKFPNPKFNLKKWMQVNGGSRVYKNYNRQKGKLADGSVEPPFLVGISCASCHVGLSPTNPPKDPENPTWHNIIGTIGGQHLRMSEILGSGMPTTNLFFQALANAEPGTTDTSAFSHDEIFNPGTINALFNTDMRVRDNVFEHDVTRNRRLADGSFSPRETKTKQPVPQILKGGEDSVGPDLAVQRVYINIGMCSRECWVNNLINARSLGEGERNTAQTPFKIEQCRRDCKEWVAIEDRVGDIFAFLKTRRPTDLKDATDERGNVGAEKVAALKKEKVMHQGVQKTKWLLGAQVFQDTCARCHTSKGPNGKLDPFATEKVAISDGNKVIRVDEVRTNWLGSDERKPVVGGGADSIGTNYCRALHSNHTEGNIWSEFAAEDLKSEAGLAELEALESREADGGRGHYRNISLLSVWATAPFMHNNALGTRLCNHTPMFDAAMKAGRNPADFGYEGCVEPYEAYTVDGRLKIFDASMRQLLKIEDRGKRTMVTFEDIEVELGGRFWAGWETMAGLIDGAGKVPEMLGVLKFLNAPEIKAEDAFKLKVPAGFPVYLLSSLDSRKFVRAQMAAIEEQPNLPLRYKALGVRMAAMNLNPDLLKAELLKFSNCRDADEAKGHEFGVDLLPVEKEALIAYLKLL